MENRKYPLFSLCGLNCGLCPNYYTAGASRCGGCGGEAFFNPACAVMKCAVRHGGVEYCFECEEYPCARYEGADEADSFITHKNQLRDMEKAKEVGMDAYRAELDEKMEILKLLLNGYNDGRRKNFFCIAVNLMELSDLRGAMAQIRAETKPGASVKENAATAVRALQERAYARGIELKLRKKAK